VTEYLTNGKLCKLARRSQFYQPLFQERSWLWLLLQPRGGEGSEQHGSRKHRPHCRLTISGTAHQSCASTASFSMPSLLDWTIFPGKAHNPS